MVFGYSFRLIESVRNGEGQNDLLGKFLPKNVNLDFKA
jgi:hypothetical protein